MPLCRATALIAVLLIVLLSAGYATADLAEPEQSQSAASSQDLYL